MSVGGLSAVAFVRFDLLLDFDRPPATSMPLGAFGSLHSSVSSARVVIWIRHVQHRCATLGGTTEDVWR